MTKLIKNKGRKNMSKYSFKFLENKIILRLNTKISENTEELITSE